MKDCTGTWVRNEYEDGEAHLVHDPFTWCPVHDDLHLVVTQPIQGDTVNKKSAVVCSNCGKPFATDEQWSAHPPGCDCQECLEVCWSEHGAACDVDEDWQARALAAEKKLRWVPVTEEMPPDMQEVQITDGEVQGAGSHLYGHWLWRDMLFNGRTVTHWMHFLDLPG